MYGSAPEAQDTQHRKMLTGNRCRELGNHIRGAINNGLTPLEIREALLQVSVYVGMPAGLEGFKIAERVIKEMTEAGEYKP